MGRYFRFCVTSFLDPLAGVSEGYTRKFRQGVLGGISVVGANQPRKALAESEKPSPERPGPNTRSFGLRLLGRSRLRCSRLFLQRIGEVLSRIKTPPAHQPLTHCRIQQEVQHDFISC